MQQVAMMKSDRERHEKVEQLRGLPIEDIIREQNMLRPVEHWVESKIMSLSAYLAAAVYYFLYGVVDQKKAVANQTVAELFKVSKSNLHRITSGRKYAGGSITTGRKLKSIQELEEHGEQMVKIVKVKTKSKPKSQKKVTMTKMTPKLYRFLSWRSKQGNWNLEGHGGEGTKIKRTMMRSQWFTKSSVYGEDLGEYSEISKILRFLRIGVTKRWDLAVAVAILENFDVNQQKCEISLQKRYFGDWIMWKKTKDCPWHTDTKPEPWLPTINATVGVSWGSSLILAIHFGLSTLGTVCCSSGKSVNLTRLREFGQITWPESSRKNHFEKVNFHVLVTKFSNSLINGCDTPV